MLRSAGMRNIFVSAVLLILGALTAHQVQAAETLPFTAQPVCGRIDLTDSGAHSLVLGTEGGRRLIVDTSALPGDVQSALAVGQEVVVLASPATEPGRLVAHGVEFATWQTAEGGPWQCFHGYVLTAEGPVLRVRLSEGNVVVVDRSSVVEDVGDLYRGEQVTVIGKVTGLNPATMLARYVLLDAMRAPWPGR